MAEGFLDGIHADPMSISRDGNNLVSSSETLGACLGKFDSNIINEVYSELKPELEAFREKLESKGNALVTAGTKLGNAEAENIERARRLDD